MKVTEENITEHKQNPFFFFQIFHGKNYTFLSFSIPFLTHKKLIAKRKIMYKDRKGEEKKGRICKSHSIQTTNFL